MERDVRLMVANEAARIGCKLSSFGFALTVQDMYETVYKKISASRDGSCIKCATDDVIVLLKVADEAELSAKVGEVMTCLGIEAEKVGLSFVNDKAQLLYPKDMRATSDVALPPGISVRSNLFSNPALRGMEIVGAPIGSPEFCSAFVKKTLDKMLLQSELLLSLHPQCAIKLLRDCVCTAPISCPSLPPEPDMHTSLRF